MIALRVPKHQHLQKLLQNFNGLFSTSANIAGKSVPRSIDDLDEDLIKSAAYVVVDSMNDKLVKSQQEIKPSTILDCSGDDIKVVREGAYPIDYLEKIAGKRFS